jgi:spheroidene monooxygenase
LSIAAGDAARPPGDRVLVVLADLAPGARLWGWSRVVRGAAALAGTPGLRLAKVMGSGQGGGFGLRPSLSHQGLFLVFADLDGARRFLERAPLMAAYRSRARELCTVLLEPLACRGSWGGRTLAVASPAPPAPPESIATCAEGLVAALTRASIRPHKAAAFWRHAAPSQQALASAQGCRLAAGLGEAPLLRQATFSVWDSVAAMERYARGPAHGDAIRAAYAGQHFSESMFARFRVLEMRGRWQGVDHG